MNTVAEESFANIRTVKAFSNEEEEMGKFANGNQITFTVGTKRAIFSALYALLTQILLYGAMAGVIYVGAFLY